MASKGHQIPWISPPRQVVYLHTAHPSAPSLALRHKLQRIEHVVPSPRLQPLVPHVEPARVPNATLSARINVRRYGCTAPAPRVRARRIAAGVQSRRCRVGQGPDTRAHASIAARGHAAVRVAKVPQHVSLECHMAWAASSEYALDGHLKALWAKPGSEPGRFRPLSSVLESNRLNSHDAGPG
jgi:hypothetical protein